MASSRVTNLSDSKVIVSYQTGFCQKEWIKLKWTLKTYFTLRLNEYYESAIPELDQAYRTKWKIQMMKTKDHVGISLYCGIHQKIVKFSFINGGGKTVVCSEANEIYPGSYVCTMDRNFIEKRLSRGFPTIAIKLFTGATRNEQSFPVQVTANWNDFYDVNEAMGLLYNSAKFSDFTITVFETHFYVHKAILQARSSFFARLLENAPNLAILSLTNPNYDIDSFRNMLQYIYTGQIEVAALRAPGLYILANDCALPRLKARCSDYMMSTLSISSVLKTIVLAKMYNDQTLKTAAISFAAKNISQVLENPEWYTFYSEHEDEVKCMLNVLSKGNISKTIH